MSRLTCYSKGHLDAELVIIASENSDHYTIDSVNHLAQYLQGICAGAIDAYNSEHPDEPEIQIAVTLARKLSNGCLQMFTITKEDIDYMLAKIPANTSVHIELITDGTEPPPITIIASTL